MQKVEAAPEDAPVRPRREKTRGLAARQETQQKAGRTRKMVKIWRKMRRWKTSSEIWFHGTHFAALVSANTMRVFRIAIEHVGHRLCGSAPFRTCCTRCSFRNTYCLYSTRRRVAATLCSVLVLASLQARRCPKYDTKLSGCLPVRTATQICHRMGHICAVTRLHVICKVRVM